jgi:hypothetical protein
MGINPLGVGVMTHMRSRVWALQGLLVLSASGCRASEVAKIEPTAEIEVEPREGPNTTPVDAPMPVPEPAPKPQPAPEPEPIVSWQPLAKPDWTRDQLLDSTADSARYGLENDRLHYQLDLHVHEESVSVTLTERDSGHALVHEWATRLYDPDFESGVAVSLGELASDHRGRQLLHLWVSHHFGEDIVFSELLELFVIVDADGLSTLWSGHTSKHASHVCGTWTDIEFELEPQALVITEYDRAKIHLPEEIPGYDCDENSREYDTVRARHRIALP